MNKIILDKTQLSILVFENRYEIDKKNKFLSRCIDGRYLNNKDLPALAFPGADAGELVLIIATANAYGFEVNPEKAYKSLVKVVGGEKNIQLHTDGHDKSGQALGGCGHIKQITLTPADYHLTDNETDFIKKKFSQAVKKGAKQAVLQGDHMEGAVVFISGNYGIYPQYLLKTESGGETNVQIFEYHQSLVDERHQVLCSTWFHQKAVKLPKDCDEEYLFQAISEVAETHTLETAKRLAKGLPIYHVKFDKEGNFDIEELGNV